LKIFWRGYIPDQIVILLNCPGSGCKMKYQASIDLNQKNNSHTLAHDMVRKHAKGGNLNVLEVGCASGYWGALLRAEGCRVVGVEPDPESAQSAKAVLDEVFIGGIDLFLDSYTGEAFDVISFVDVLEHTRNPQEILLRCQSILNDNGIIVCSVPNVAHLSIRTMLLAGKWDYVRTGIMDDSHIVFFTKNTIIDLFGKSGLNILDMKATVMDAAAAHQIYGTYSPLWLRFIAALTAMDCCWRDFQYVTCVRKAGLGKSEADENSRFASRGNALLAWKFKLGVVWDIVRIFFLTLAKGVLRRK